MANAAVAIMIAYVPLSGTLARCFKFRPFTNHGARHWHWQFPLSLGTPQSGGALRGDSAAGAVFSSEPEWTPARVHSESVRVRLGSDSDAA
jgi:hypothetical protein